MTKKLSWCLLAAALVFGGSQLVSAQDQTTAPADQNAPAAAPTPAPSTAPAKRHHHHGMMDACKDDAAANCAGMKGKAMHKCMDEADKAGKLSQGCQDARAKAKAHWMKHHHKKAAEAPAAPAPSEQPSTNTPAPAAPQAQ